MLGQVSKTKRPFCYGIFHKGENPPHTVMVIQKNFWRVFRKPSKKIISVNSQNVIGFLQNPPSFTLSTFDVVYPKF